MQIGPYRMIMPENEEEKCIMGQISLLVCMAKLEEAKKLAEESNLLEYFDTVLEDYKRRHNGLHRET